MNRYIDLISYGSLATDSISSFVEEARKKGFKIRLWETSAITVKGVANVEVIQCQVKNQSVCTKIWIAIVWRLNLLIRQSASEGVSSISQLKSWGSLKTNNGEGVIAASTSLVVALDQTSVYPVWEIAQECQAPCVFGLAAALTELQKVNYI